MEKSIRLAGWTQRSSTRKRYIRSAGRGQILEAGLHGIPVNPEPCEFLISPKVQSAELTELFFSQIQKVFIIR